MERNHEYVMKIRNSLLKLFLPTIFVGAVFVMIIALMIAGGSLINMISIIVIGISLIFVTCILLTHNSFMYFVTARIRERKGIWFGVFTCNCKRDWVKALEKDELEKCKEKVGKHVMICSCNEQDPTPDECDVCEWNGRCRTCGEKITLAKLMKKRIA